jgi:exodeoxyribonuclease V alpha subunit
VRVPLRTPQPWAVALGPSLAEALPRLYGTPCDPLIGELINALAAALERGELELNLNGPPPAEVSEASWPEEHRRALADSPLGREPDGPLALEE